MQNKTDIQSKFPSKAKALEIVDFKRFLYLVPRVGLEPTHLSAGDFESPASTNFTTRAVFVKTRIMAQYAHEIQDD